MKGLITTSKEVKSLIMKNGVALICFILFMCQSMPVDEFIKLHENDTFEEFKNTGFVLRGRDAEGNLLVFANNNLDSALKSGPCIISINKQKMTVASISCKLNKDSSNVDKQKLCNLVLVFISYNISRLSVDNFGNVLIGLRNMERPEIAKFPSESNHPTIYGEWKLIKGHWYRNTQTGSHYK